MHSLSCPTDFSPFFGEGKFSFRAKLQVRALKNCESEAGAQHHDKKDRLLVPPFCKGSNAQNKRASSPPLFPVARPARDTSDHHHPRPRRPPVLVLFHCLPAPLHYGQVQAATFGHEHDAAAEAAVVRRAGAPSKIQSQFQHTNRSGPEWGTWNKSRLQPFFTASAPEFRTYPTPSSTQSRKDTPRVPGRN